VTVDLEGHWALITGGTRGIGFAIARRLARRGCALLLAHKRDELRAAEAKAELEDLGVEVATHCGDLRRTETLHGLVEAISTGPDRLDILIHNASFGAVAPLRRIGPAAWNAAFETNVTALLQLVQKTLPWLERRGGQILAISSVGSQICYTDYASVGCSKAALEGLIRYLAFELSGAGIRCNAVSGGPVETRALSSFPDPEAVRAYASEFGPRMGQPEDLAEVADLLLRPESQWISGQTIVADGGLTLGIDFSRWRS
jgi:NAD(P)-dependent dehydrogenase (short-subunit alcohol dehydrogenase family)